MILVALDIERCPEVVRFSEFYGKFNWCFAHISRPHHFLWTYNFLIKFVVKFLLRMRTRVHWFAELMLHVSLYALREVSLYYIPQR